MAHVVRYFLSIAMACVALLGAPAAFALDTGDIVVASVKGEVHVTMKGAARAVRAGSVLELPATVRTGRDGAIELKQGATAVSIGPETLLEFPAQETRGGPIDRIVQPRGNAFYDIGKRAGRKLRVETPYLVGVVKGTQFNVAAQDDATTISLFEGLLEIRASDDSAVVDIKAGEIAKRGRGGKGIDVIKMDGGKAPPTTRPPGAGSGNPSPTTPRPDGSDAPGEVSLVSGRDEARPELLVDPAGETNFPVAATVDLRGGADVGVTLETSDVANAGVPAAVDLNIGAGAPDVAVAAATELNAGVANVDLGAVANVDLDTDSIDVGAGVSAGPVGVDTTVNAGVDLGAGAASVDVAASTGVNVGSAAAVDVGVGAAVDVGAGAVSVDVGASTNVDLGNAAAVDIGAAAAVDVGAGVAASVDVNAGVDAGPLSTDAGAGVAVDLGGGGGAASVDLGATADAGGAVAVDAGVGADVGAGNGMDVAAGADVGASVAGVDAGVSTGVDVGAGTVDLGVTVGGADLGVGVDLGLDNDDQGQDTSNTASTPGNDSPGNVVDDVVDTVDGLLNGLLRKPGRK